MLCNNIAMENLELLSHFSKNFQNTRTLCFDLFCFSPEVILWHMRHQCPPYPFFPSPSYSVGCIWTFWEFSWTSAPRFIIPTIAWRQWNFTYLFIWTHKAALYWIGRFCMSNRCSAKWGTSLLHLTICSNSSSSLSYLPFQLPLMNVQFIEILHPSFLHCFHAPHFGL